MQMATIGAAVAGLDEMPKVTRQTTPNPLVNTYQTSDGRWIALCMLQPDLYWAPFCEAIGRSDLADGRAVRHRFGARRAHPRRSRRARPDVPDEDPGRVDPDPVRAAGAVGRRQEGLRAAPGSAGGGQRVHPADRLRRGSGDPADREPDPVRPHTARARARARLRERHRRDPAVPRLGLGPHHRGQGVRRRVVTAAGAVGAGTMNDSSLTSEPWIAP